ncbi:MAG TPA: protein translocase subunit SecD [Bacilli bacterium]|nr:protein translocase subunit SecD [Bacilli bacterium]
MKKVIKLFIILLISIGVVGLISIFLLKDLNFGLDLKGGFEILYKVKKTDNKKLESTDLESTYNTLVSRIDKLGVSEPEITIEGNNIRVKLAGITNSDKARDALSMVADISFRDTNDNLLMSSNVIRSAKLSTDNAGKPAIALSIKDKDKFLEVTTDISKKSDNVIVIWRDFKEDSNSYSNEKSICGSSESNCLSAANVSQGFSSDVIITGNFTTEEAKSLATAINSGFTNTKLEEISSQTVNASFGVNTLNKTLYAGIIGLVGVIIFMTIIYRFSGFISSLTLAFYMFFVLGIFWLIGGVLTLPGIAAIVLGIGMAVDSCCITLERVKEELRKGKTLGNAVKEGNKMSFASILDANVTTLLAAIILFIFGESTVKGFATVLIITIIVTMVIMVYLLRFILNKFINSDYFNSREKLLLGKYKKSTKEKNFIKFTKHCFIFTSIITVIGLFMLFKSGLNLGIDFKSGTDITIIAKNNITENIIRNDLDSLGYKKIVSSELKNSKTVYIKMNEVLNKSDVKNLNTYFNTKYEAKTEIGIVSNLVKRQLIKNALEALIFAAIGMTIYITLRYKFSYAIVSILALLHDLLIIVFVFAITRLEVSSIFIAALLTIIGYSINNTIIVFDRVREGLKGKLKLNKDEFTSLVNQSLTRIFKRALYTTITTIIPVISLIIFGSISVFTFNIALLVGLVAGTFSSLVLAPQLWYIIEKKKKVTK